MAQQVFLAKLSSPSQFLWTPCTTYLHRHTYISRRPLQTSITMNKVYVYRVFLSFKLIPNYSSLMKSAPASLTWYVQKLATVSSTTEVASQCPNGWTTGPVELCVNPVRLQALHNMYKIICPLLYLHILYSRRISHTAALARSLSNAILEMFYKHFRLEISTNWNYAFIQQILKKLKFGFRSSLEKCLKLFFWNVAVFFFTARHGSSRQFLNQLNIFSHSCEQYWPPLHF
jgi:hypothetical protein